MSNENHHPPDESDPEESPPEIDDLLDELERNAEVRSDPPRRMFGTLVAASLFLALGLWQFVHISNGGVPMFRPAAHVKQGPAKTRSERLLRLRMNVRSTNPVTAYIERAKRGMTDREIRWMIEDFQAAGLDRQERDLKGARRAREQLWYLQAMSEALQLSPQQRTRAKLKMDALLAADVKTSNQGIAGVAGHERFTKNSNAFPAAPSGDAPVWLLKDAYAPWNLCDLTPEQDQLTMHHWRESKRKNKPAITEGAQESQPWIRISTTRQDPKNGNLIELGDDNPYAPGFPEGYMLLGRIMVMDAFPLTPEQKPDGTGVSGLDQARSLQAPQLRFALLMDSSVALRLLLQLDHPITRQGANEKPGGIIMKGDKTPADPASRPDSK